MAQQTAAAENGIVEQVDKGDHLKVDLPSPANPFGDTQTGELTVTKIEGDMIRGTGSWDDDVTLDCGSGKPQYQDCGKGGEVVEVRKHKRHPDGGVWGNKYEVLWEADE